MLIVHIIVAVADQEHGPCCNAEVVPVHYKPKNMLTVHIIVTDQEHGPCCNAEVVPVHKKQKIYANRSYYCG